MSAHRNKLILIGILLAGVAMSIVTTMHAYHQNGAFGFPLDDPWIHLQFAKNLHDYGTFSYYKNEMITSGSTSPLYTFLLALGFLGTNNEMLMSYFFGCSFLLLSGIFFFKLLMKSFQEGVLVGSVAVGLLMFEPRLQWIALSGMETTLFIFLLLTVTYFYKTSQGIYLGISSGLLLWSRPEGLLFVGVIAIDRMYHQYVTKLTIKKSKSELRPFFETSIKQALVIFFVLGALYAGFNFWLSGSFFPNTYAAKIKYYSSGDTNFPEQVYHFLVDGHLAFFFGFVVLGILSCFQKIIRRQPNDILLPMLWSFSMFFVYWKNLPYLYQEGRYLMPILPFILLLGLHGIQIALGFGKKFILSLRKEKIAAAVSLILLLIFLGQFAWASWENRLNYAEQCKYINDRQVNTAKWLHQHLPEDAVIATHDIGAVAFYSGRRITDMVGLVSPEMIQNIGSFDRLKKFLISKRTTHIAVLRNWFELVNVNPIFQTDERYPEIMEVFEFDAARINFTPQQATRITETARYYLSLGNYQQAIPLLEQALRLDPQSSKTHFFLGRAYLGTQNLVSAETEFQNAIQLHPTHWDARSSMAEIALRRNNPQEAIVQLESIVQQNPLYANGYRVLADMYRTFRNDSVKANEYLQSYNRLMNGVPQ